MNEGPGEEIDRLPDADLREELPEAVEAEANRLLPAEERRLISLYSDTTADGNRFEVEDLTLLDERSQRLPDKEI